MLRVLFGASVILLVAGCASIPVKQQAQQHQVNRAKKADKYVMPKKAVETPNQVIEKRWFPKFRIQWLHPK